MGDSDDDNDMRKTRDKFRRERCDVDSRREKREPFDGRAGEGHSNSLRLRSARRPDYRSLGVPQDRPSFGTELPLKRPRREWNNDSLPCHLKDAKKEMADTEANYRPPLIPFKRFIEPLDDFITDEEAIAKYKEYKEAFNKRYIEEFFEAHKNEEWLREKYHPDFIDNTREQIAKNIRQRLDVFLDLFDKGMIDNQSVDVENAKNLIKLMDAVVIKLAGGTDEDLAVLNDSDAIQDGCKSSQEKVSRIKNGKKSEGEESDLYSEDEKFNSCKFSEKDNPELMVAEPKKEQTVVDNDWTGVSSESESEENSKFKEHIHDEEEEDYDGDIKGSDNYDEGPSQFGATENEESEEIKNIKMEEDANITEHPTDNGIAANECPLTTEGDPKNSSKRPSARLDLHKTASIFFRCLPPTITRKELEDICSEQPGFMRLAFYDPMPERRFTRHAWATYKPNVNIKKVCWTLNANPILREKWQQGRDSDDLCATVNRDLAQRIRPVPAALTRHRPVMRNDLRIASRFVAQLDAKHSLWSLPGEGVTGDAVTNACPVPGLPGVFSANPLMRNLTDFLIDETASEEEAMLNRNSVKGLETFEENGDKGASVPIDTDPSLLCALDRLIIYLRIVYSIDYYAATFYRFEDLMPHRCGIFHARGSLNLRDATTNAATVNQHEISDYINTFNEKIASLLDVPRDLTDEEIKALGAKDPDLAAEEFIEASIQKRTSKKKPCKVVWVCSLSDKKFREPVFVRKHILNKHMDKVEAAKKNNAVFFNNFLRDPKRLSLPEAPRHLNRYCPTSTAIGSVGDMIRMRGRNLVGQRTYSGYRGNGEGGYRKGLTSYGRRAYGGGHNAMATASSGAVNFYDRPSLNDVFVFAGRGSGRGGSPRGREHNNRKRPHPDDGPGAVARGVISYNDLDDPKNGNF